MFTPEVTITLGRSAQVVKRKRTDFERLPNNRDNRQRDAAVKGNCVEGLQLDRNDLRHKLIRRRLSSGNCVAASGDERRIELKGEYSGAPERSSLSSDVLQQGSGSQCHQERRVLRDPYREAAKCLHYTDRSSDYSTVYRDDFPARPAHNSGCLTHRTDLQRVTPIRSIKSFGSRPAYSKPLSGSTRATLSADIMSVTELERAKPVALFPSSDIMRRGLFTAEAPATVTGLLNSLGLGKYAIHFQAEEVDMSVLKQMGEKDLKDLGIPMGPRKKILQALSALFKRKLVSATVVS